MTITDPFPSSDFDPWAETYDQDVQTYTRFPFDGYERVLDTIVRLCEPLPGMSVLDLGTGTGNLAVRFAERGCKLWCTDFSEAMLAKARAKLPQAQFALHDLRADWPGAFERRFDRIISAYVFHHFELEKKVALCKELVAQRLIEDGKLVIADLSFVTQAALNTFKQQIDDWEDEFFWLADNSIAALENAGLKVEYTQVSPCAGVYQLA